MPRGVAAPGGNRDRAVEIGEFSRKIHRLKPIDTTSPEAVWKRYEEYADLCVEHGIEQTMAFAAKALGSSWGRLAKLMRGTVAPTERWPEESIAAVKEIYDYVEAQAELHLIDPANKNAAQRIFQMKNRFGWTDVREEHKIVEQRQLAPASAAELDELAKKYLAQAGAVEVECEVKDG